MLTDAPLSRAGLTPDQHHPKYLAMMQTGPIGLLNILCRVGGRHPCLDRLLDHPRCSDILERLLSFISRCPGVATAATREQFAELALAGVDKHPCFALAGVPQSPSSFVRCQGCTPRDTL